MMMLMMVYGCKAPPLLLAHFKSRSKSIFFLLFLFARNPSDIKRIVFIAKCTDVCCAVPRYASNEFNGGAAAELNCVRVVLLFYSV